MLTRHICSLLTLAQTPRSPSQFQRSNQTCELNSFSIRTAQTFCNSTLKTPAIRCKTILQFIECGTGVMHPLLLRDCVVRKNGDCIREKTSKRLISCEHQVMLTKKSIIKIQEVKVKIE